MSRSVGVRAWLLAEGDVFAGGERVISVQRDPALYRVTVVTSDGARRTLNGEDWLVIARRAAADVTPEPSLDGRADVIGWLVRAAGRPRGQREDGGW